MAYSNDLKQAALAAIDRGGDTKVGIAKTFGVVRQTLENWLAERAAERAGTRPPPAKRGPKPKLGAEAVAKLSAVVAAKPDGTIAEFHQQLGAPVHPNTVWRALRGLGHTFKKRPCGPTRASAPTSPPRGPRGRTASRPG
jgi:transposase